MSDQSQSREGSSFTLVGVPFQSCTSRLLNPRNWTKALNRAAQARPRSAGRFPSSSTGKRSSAQTGAMPALYIREGKITEELIKLIDEEAQISLLVLGAAAEAEGPGPIVSQLIGKMTGRVRVPITIVPGSLTDEQINAIT